MNSTGKPPKNKNIRRGAVVAALAVATLGAGVFASFTDTETATRSVDNGQLDITVGPEVLSVTDMAPGDIFSRGVVIDIPAATNDGDLIETLNVDINSSIITSTCGDANPVCENELAQLLDGNALQATVLACPSGGQISDAKPTVDDDGDTGTDSRYDGPGPYTCSTGDFAIPVYPDMVRKAGTYGAGDDGFGFGESLGPWAFGADYYDTGRLTEYATQVYDPVLGTFVDATEMGPLGVFVDGTKIEAVTCIKMPDDIINSALAWTYGGVPPVGVDLALEDNDYMNLQADIDFSWTANQRVGVPMPTTPSLVSGEIGETTAGCVAAFNGDIDDPTDPTDPVGWGDGDNTIKVFAFHDGLVGEQSNGQFNPGGDFPDDDDTLNAGIDVVIHPSGEPSDVHTATTGSNGWLQFDDVPDGTYVLSYDLGNSGNLAPTGVGDDATDNDFSKDGTNAVVSVTVAGGQVVECWLGLAGGAG